MSIKKIAIILFATINTNAVAEEKPWTISTGLSYRDSNFNLPTNKNSSEYWSTNLSLSRKMNDVTWVGGSIAYNEGNVRYKTLSGRGDTDTTSIGAFVTRNVSWGLYVTGALNYGKLDISNKFTSTKFDTDADYTSASLGLTQYIPLSQNLMSSLNARYTHISSNVDSFVTNAGSAVGSSDSSLNFVTLGGRLDYKLQNWTPYVRLDWHKASREFIQNTGDEDYFNYGLGANYAVNTETTIGFSLDSVLEKRYANETSIGINLSHRF
ncbi:MAG: autotransporter outer membrane beta-barrel domain-containing protein [Methylotenera sp.]|nr:autotransporter outer membrane beta-barrel domain-containing protein [Methylotenera sp.]